MGSSGKPAGLDGQGQAPAPLPQAPPCPARALPLFVSDPAQRGLVRSWKHRRLSVRALLSPPPARCALPQTGKGQGSKTVECFATAFFLSIVSKFSVGTHLWQISSFLLCKTGVTQHPKATEIPSGIQYLHTRGNDAATLTWSF